METHKQVEFYNLLTEPKKMWKQFVKFQKYRKVMSSRFPIGVPTKYKPGFRWTYNKGAC